MKRYQEIIVDFPENINEQDFDLLNLKKKIMISWCKKCVSILICALRNGTYCDGLLDSNFWNLWSAGMTIAQSKPAFVNAWKIVKIQTV